METSCDEPLIRITICVHRKPGLTEEEFHHYWSHTHGPLAAEWLQRCGVVKYIQYHTTSKHRAMAHKMADEVGRPVLDWDGMADFYVRRYEDFEEAFLVEEYKERIRPDELKFIDMETIQLTVGVEHACIEGAQVVKHEQKR